MKTDKWRFFKRLKRFNYRYFRMKLYDRNILKNLESHRGESRILTVLVTTPEEVEKHMQAFREIISPYYDDYIRTVSSEVMAMSLELAIFMLALCEITRPKKVVDFGSGFSSFCLRFWIKNYSPETEVYSVDDASDWLVKTREFLHRNNLSDDHVLTWEEFTRGSHGKFDLVLYDFGTFPVRKESLNTVVDYASQPSVLILDDMHQADYALYVKDTLTRRNLECLSARNYTLGKFSRYAYLSLQ